MTLVLKTTTDKGAIGWNRFGWGKYLSNCVQNPLLKKLLDKTGGLFARGFSFMEKRKDLGSSYTLIFKKESY